MNKKFLAVALATLMILGILPVLVPLVPVAHAQETGPACDLAGLKSNFQAPAGTPTPPFCVFLHPGVADPYKLGWSHTLDTLWGFQAHTKSGDPFPGTPETNGQTREVFDKYLDYSVLASSSDSIGDLQFDVVIPALNVSEIRIYVPPEFKFLAPTVKESVWTDITNDYSFIGISVRNEYDSIAPHWTRITIGNEGYVTVDNLIIHPGVYHIRLFNVRAPSDSEAPVNAPTGPAQVPGAGLYFFKVYYKLTTATGGAGGLTSVGVGNYPFIVVKSELNPAWVEVTVRTHNLEAGPGGAFVSGEITAIGTTTEGRTVVANAFWGPTEFIGNNPVPPGPFGALYRVYLFGLAAGTYTIIAEASGYNPSVSERFTVDAGQSYHMRIVIYGSAELSVTVWSKHGTGAIPWHNLWQLPLGTNNPALAPVDTGPRRDIFFDLYSADGMLLGFWGSDFFGVRGIPANNILEEGAPTPSATSYHAILDDISDLLGNVRDLTSTNWEGHVPWDTPDYVWGIPQGTYTLEVYVTGYIMDESDSYQRTVVVSQSGPGIHVEQQIDLRRSNWIEDTIHLQGTTLVAPFTTVTLTATDAGGNERGAASFYVTPAMALDGVIDGVDHPGINAILYHGGIVIEGWNSLFPNGAGGNGVKDLTKPSSGTINDNHKDYGLNPTASTHSAGTVTLAGNPYTIKLYMSDMGIPWLGMVGTGWYTIVGGDPQVSVFLCNSPVSLSFMVQNASIWISLRSVDFEVPAHSMPWTFPGSEVWVQFKDVATGDVVDTLDPTVYGLVQDAGVNNKTLTDDLGSEWRTFFNITGVNYLGAVGTWGYKNGIVTPANFVGWGVTPFDVDNEHHPGMHEHLGVWYTGTDWASPSGGIGGETDLFHALLPGWRSTRLPAGEYTYQAFTHGYIMRRSFAMQIPAYGKGDIEADMIQGAQVRVLMEFFKEGVKVPFNGFVNVEVYDSNNVLVGASIYGQAEPNVFLQTYHPYESIWDWQVRQGPSQAAGFGIPYSSNILGPSNALAGFPSNSSEQRAFISMKLSQFAVAPYLPSSDGEYYDVPNQTWAAAFGHSHDVDFLGWPNMYPSDANRLQVPAASAAAVDVYGFYWYWGSYVRTWAGGWPTTDGSLQMDGGIKGTPDIPGWPGSGGGQYTVKVWAFDPRGFNGAIVDGTYHAFEPSWGHSYVLGDHYEFAPPTDDWQMYSMGADLTNIVLPWGGVQELYVPMNCMAKLEGTIRWYDMFGTLRPLPWARISATDPAPPDLATASPEMGYPAYSSGNGGIGVGASDSAGAYVMWLPSGSHDVSVDTTEAPGVWASAGSPADAPTFNAQYTVVVQPGWVGGGDSNLGESGTAVPEVPAFLLPLTLIAALGASVWLLRKNGTSNIPVLMK